MEDRNECDKSCGMNYCDENGCTNRKRDLVDLVDVIKDNSIDWNHLREEFFSEHTDKDTRGFIHITTAAHDLFEWFKSKLYPTQNTVSNEGEKCKYSEEDLRKAFHYGNTLHSWHGNEVYFQEFVKSINPPKEK